MRACSGVRKEWATRTWVAQVRKKTTRLVIQPAVYKRAWSRCLEVLRPPFLLKMRTSAITGDQSRGWNHAR